MQFSRFISQIGQDNFDKITKQKVMIFGIGGVGGYVCESLARSGISDFILIDSDKVEITNINRQIVATLETIGKSKVQVMKDRILSINKDAKVEIIDKFYLPENSGEFDFEGVTYIIDCVDTVTAKLSIVSKAKELNISVISAMGAGNKMDPSKLEVSDIFKTSIDPLCKVMRRELKKRGVKKLKVVYSKEKALTPLEADIEEEDSKRRSIPGSVAFVPSVSGLIIASEVVKDLINFDPDNR